MDESSCSNVMLVLHDDSGRNDFEEEKKVDMLESVNCVKLIKTHQQQVQFAVDHALKKGRLSDGWSDNFDCQTENTEKIAGNTNVVLQSECMKGMILSRDVSIPSLDVVSGKKHDVEDELDEMKVEEDDLVVDGGLGLPELKSLSPTSPSSLETESPSVEDGQDMSLPPKLKSLSPSSSLSSRSIGPVLRHTSNSSTLSLRQRDESPSPSGRCSAPSTCLLEPVSKNELHKSRSRRLLSVGVDDFEALKILDSGDVGCVFLAKDRAESRLRFKGKFAVKVLDKFEMYTRNKLRRVQTELDVLSSVEHPFLVKMYYAFQTERKLCFVLEYCAGGSLLNLMESQPEKRMRESAARFFCSEILIGLEYLHLQGIMYRDLKPENVLIKESGHIALTDFDLSHIAKNTTFLDIPSYVRHHDSKRKRRDSRSSKLRRRMSAFSSKTGKFLNDGNKAVIGDPGHETKTDDNVGVVEVSKKSRSFVGTCYYIAPEIASGKEYSHAVDWWAFGVNMYEMLYGRVPFEDLDQLSTFALIKDPNTNVTFDRTIKVSKGAKDLLTKLLTKDPHSRLIDPNVMKGHKFFKGVNWALLLNETPPLVPSQIGLEHHQGLSVSMSSILQEGPEVPLSEIPRFDNFSFIRKPQ